MDIEAEFKLTTGDFVDDPVTKAIIACAIKVHRALGPGLLESAYQACLAHELTRTGLGVERELPLPVRYEGLDLPCGYRLDLVVDHQVIVEVKAVERVLPIHEAQLMTYLRLSCIPRGLLINFHVALLKHGITRRVLTKPEFGRIASPSATHPPSPLSSFASPAPRPSSSIPSSPPISSSPPASNSANSAPLR